MADNTTLNPGTGGDIIRTVDRTDFKTQVVGIDFGGDTGMGYEAMVTLNNPFPVQPAATYYVQSSENSTTSQLAASAIFTGTIVSTINQQSLSLLITADQPVQLIVNQYITSDPSSLASSWEYNIAANQGFAQSMTLNANFFNLTIKNVGASTTTTLNVNAYFGTIFPAGQVPTQGATPIVPGILQHSFDFTSNGQSTVIVNASYGTMSLQLTSMGTGGQLAFSGSNDGINYHELYGYYYEPDIGYNRLLASVSTAAAIKFDISGVNFIKIAVTALTSGTISGSIYGSLSSSVVSVSSVAKTPQYPAAPSSVSIGATSTSVVSANASRTGLILTNTSNNIISISLNGAAVLNSGITLTPYGCFTMDSDSFTTNAITAIASSAGSNLAIQEFS